MRWKCATNRFKLPEFIELLREHDIALVVADTAGKWPFMEDTTSDFVYVRLHGDGELYASGYTASALGALGEEGASMGRRRVNPATPNSLPPRRRREETGRDVFVYFDNDVKVRAPYDAMSLAHRWVSARRRPKLRSRKIQRSPAHALASGLE